LLLRASHAHVEFRKALPPGFLAFGDAEQFGESARRLLSSIVDCCEMPRVLYDLKMRFI
jgi:hypothetical protein